MLRYPLRVFGARIGRVVSIFRLKSGTLILHSTGPFTEQDRRELAQLGAVEALVDVTKFHDTFAETGRAMFPEASYFAPAGFPLKEKLKAKPIEAGKEIWGDELIWIPLEGVPGLEEWACYHPESRTLVLADLLFNCRPTDWRGKVFFGLAGIRGWPGNCRLFRMFIRDREKLEQSIRALCTLDFDRLIVAHGEPINRDAKAVFRSAIQRAFPWMNL
jgi:hypothetical protein